VASNDCNGGIIGSSGEACDGGGEGSESSKARKGAIEGESGTGGLDRGERRRSPSFPQSLSSSILVAASPDLHCQG
jgi:hypothetical protein